MLKKEKLTDVQKLIENHFGESWQELSVLAYYKEVMERLEGNVQEEDAEDQPDCEGCPDDEDLH